MDQTDISVQYDCIYSRSFICVTVQLEPQIQENLKIGWDKVIVEKHHHYHSDC